MSEQAMRILIQNPYVRQGGAESRLRVLIRHLLRHPRIGELHLLVAAGQEWPTDERHPRLSVHPSQPADVADWTEAIVRERDIDLVQLHNEIEIGTDGLRRAQQRGIPTVWVAHDYWPICGWRFGIDVFRAEETEPCEVVAPERCLECVGPDQLEATARGREAVLGCDAGVVPSARVGELLAANGVLPGRLRTIEPWIDLELFGETPPRPRSPWRVLFAGNLLPHKGVGILLDAWQQVNRWLPAAELLIVADERNADAVRHRIERLGLSRVEVRRPQPQAQLAGLYASSRVTVFPSLWEEVIGLVWVESLACGTPVIASRTGSIPALLREGGVLVPPGDAGALAQAIHDFLVTPQRAIEMGRRGRADVLGRFRADRAAEAFVDLYQGLILTARSGRP